ncbi:hypothetical protein CVT25_000304, partial [Psilocybe cyanescens]
MAKKSVCPGCKGSFFNGRPFTKHVSSCKKFDNAADTAIKQHKIAAAKKAEEKRLEIEKRKELILQEQTVPPEDLDDEAMEIDDETPAGPSFKTPSPLPSPPLYSPSPPRRPSGLIARKTRMPLRFRDELPASPPVVIVSKEFDIEADEDYSNNTGPSSSQVSQSGDISYVTEPNRFG